jgi:endonuclease YncB( thermonuclease family)
MQYFPGHDSPLHAVTVHHLVTSSRAPKAHHRVTIERIISPCVYEGVLLPSLTTLKLRVSGILPANDDGLNDLARDAVFRKLLHRTISVLFDGFDEATGGMWVSFATIPVLDKLLVEEGLARVDSRSSHLSRHALEFSAAEEKAVVRKVGMWAESSHQGSTQAITSIAGRVVAVPDEVTLFVRLTDVGCQVAVDDDDENSPAVVSTMRSLKPLHAGQIVRCRVAFMGIAQQPAVQTTECGVIRRHSTRAFFGRELLRTIALDRVVSFTGVSGVHFDVSATDSALVGSFGVSESLIGNATVEGSGDLATMLLSRSHSSWYTIQPLGGGLEDILRMPLTLLRAAANRELRRKDEIATASPPGDSLRRMDILTIETEHQLKSFVRSQQNNTNARGAAEGGSNPRDQLLSGAPLPGIVETVCFDPKLSLGVYFPSLGISVDLQLEGVRFPAFGSNEKTDVETVAQARYHTALLDALVMWRIVHRLVDVSVFACCPGAACVRGSLRVDGALLAEMLIEAGLAVASRLVVTVPIEVSKIFLAAQRTAQSQCRGIWDASFPSVISSLACERRQETNMDDVISVAGVEGDGDLILVLGPKDHSSFYFRYLKDQRTFKKICEVIARALSPVKSVQDGDIVAAPRGNSYFRAVVSDIREVEASTSQSVSKVCKVRFLDIGGEADFVPLSALRTQSGKQKNSLAQWPPLALAAKHAGICIPGNVSPDVVEVLEEYMSDLVQLEQLQMYRMYSKYGVPHVFLLPPGEKLLKSTDNPFELALWAAIERVQQELKTHPSARATLETGCGEFPSLVQWLALLTTKSRC